jgi:DNA-binding transcriptional MerR regulator
MLSAQDIPDKLYFRIGEVAEIIGVPSYVLRFWETEFPLIRPKRTGSGQRLYRKTDVELILTIKHLLHEKRFTIEGAKQHLRARTPSKPAAEAPCDPQLLNDIKMELQRIRDLLG